MRHRGAFRAAIVVATISLVALLLGPAGAQTEADVDEARREVEDAARRVEGEEADLRAARAEEELATDEMLLAVTRYEEVNGELQDVTFRASLLADRLTAYEEDLRNLRSEVRDLATEAYMAGGDSDLLFFEAETFNQLVTGQEVLDRATDRNLSRFDRLEVTKRDLDRLRDQYGVEQDLVGDLQDEAAELVTMLAEVLDRREGETDVEADQLATAEGELSQAQGALAREKQELEAEKRRQRLAATARRSGAAAGFGRVPGAVCPVAGPNAFIDSWGFARSGGRSHKGTDMFGKRNTPLVAIDNGTVTLGSNNLGGLTVWLATDHGISYYYAHLEAYGPGLSSGERVSRGQTVGFLGNSGNARYTSPHLHIQQHPGGRGSPAVNPYPTMVHACG